MQTLNNCNSNIFVPNELKPRYIRKGDSRKNDCTLQKNLTDIQNFRRKYLLFPQRKKNLFIRLSTSTAEGAE